jgi:thiol-disulfide isomerase/thioredoxin
MDKLYIIVLICIIIGVIAFTLYRNKHENFTTEKNRITLYFSPSCGHCKAFMGTWNNFENRVNNHNDMNLEATKINCQSHECPNIVGFPTVLLHKNTGETVQFQDQRTVDALVNFAKNNC